MSFSVRVLTGYIRFLRLPFTTLQSIASRQS